MVFSNIHTADFSLDMINRLNTENDFHSVSERGQGKKMEGEVSRRRRGGCEEWEARDEWNQPAVVWSVPCDGRTPLSHSISSTLPPSFSQSLKSLLSGFSEQKEAPMGALYFLSPMKWCIQHNRAQHNTPPPTHTHTPPPNIHIQLSPSFLSPKIPTVTPKTHTQNMHLISSALNNTEGTRSSQETRIIRKTPGSFLAVDLTALLTWTIYESTSTYTLASLNEVYCNNLVVFRVTLSSINTTRYC